MFHQYFSSCHDFEGPIVFNILHYIKTIKSTHKTSLFFWGFHRKNPWFFVVKPTSCNPPSLPDPTKTPQKESPTENPPISIRICWRHLFGLGPVHVGYIAEWNAEMARFFVALRFLTVLTVDLLCECAGRVGGQSGLLGKFKAVKRCANDGKFVFLDSDEALGESFKKSPGQFVQMFSKSWFFKVDFKKQTLSTKKHPKKA